MSKNGYRFWWDVAHTTRLHSESRGYRYRDGVERESALAACEVQLHGREAAVDAIEDVFKRCLIPGSRWDGSIA